MNVFSRRTSTSIEKEQSQTFGPLLQVRREHGTQEFYALGGLAIGASLERQQRQKSIGWHQTRTFGQFDHKSSSRSCGRSGGLSKRGRRVMTENGILLTPDELQELTEIRGAIDTFFQKLDATTENLDAKEAADVLQPIARWLGELTDRVSKRAGS